MQSPETSLKPHQRIAPPLDTHHVSPDAKHSRWVEWDANGGTSGAQLDMRLSLEGEMIGRRLWAGMKESRRHNHGTAVVRTEGSGEGGKERV